MPVRSIVGALCSEKTSEDVRGVLEVVDTLVVDVIAGVVDRINEMPLELFVGVVVSPFFKDETLKCECGGFCGRFVVGFALTVGTNSGYLLSDTSSKLSSNSKLTFGRSSVLTVS